MNVSEYDAAEPLGEAPEVPGVVSVCARVDALERAVAAVRQLHRPFDRRTMLYRPVDDPHDVVCGHCLGPIDYPCPTVVALGEAQ